MKPCMVAFVLASVLALAAMGAPPLAVDGTQAASLVATRSAAVATGLAAALGVSASVAATADRLVAAARRQEERRAPRAPADRRHYRGDSAIQVSVANVLDRRRRALQEGAFS
jgi:hypothetical protein